MSRRRKLRRSHGGAALTAVLLLGTLFVSPGTAASAACTGSGWVASWAASPTDALVPVDASGGPAPTSVTRQTLRMMISPHLGGSTLRIRLTNRFGSSPVTFGRVTVAKQQRGAAIGAATPVLFGGKTSVTVPAGSDLVSDATQFTFAAFDHLAVSMYVPGRAESVTKHWNANATSYLTPALSGDRTAETSGAPFTTRTGSWLYLGGLDVEAPTSTHAVVAFGDSITDGFVGGSPLSIPADKSVADTDQRYPDFLQRRLLDAGAPISIVNAGIGSNMLLTDGTPLMLGPSGVKRFGQDALAHPGVTGVLLLEGINDLGLTRSSAVSLIAGLTTLVDQAHAAGVKVWLGTILPASNALIDGTLLAPDSERNRQQVNTWIRQQDLADGVVDFDLALRDPSNPSVLRAEYASVDNLHPSPAGYRAMAQTVDLNLLASPGCAA
ncbi:GDSL-type esterase/lipase family protein [Cryptosporangium minutisporangium]|uniref:SGNH/GDSL hydrolase family protein n=1 Tax=Cryptosporangium minutisporangium TaxID=113569 RepID=A0ABP6SSZ9_9ACTN